MTLWSLLIPNYECNTTQLDLVEFFSDQTLARFVFGALQLVTSSLLNAKRRVSAEPIEAYGNGSIGPILLMCVCGSTGQAVLYSYVCKWFHMSRISAAFGLNSRYLLVE